MEREFSLAAKLSQSKRARKNKVAGLFLMSIGISLGCFAGFCGACATVTMKLFGMDYGTNYLILTILFNAVMWISFATAMKGPESISILMICNLATNASTSVYTCSVFKLSINDHS